MMFFDNWFDSFFNNKLKPIFCQAAFTFSGSCMSFLQQLHGREECFWIFEMVLERLR